MAMARRAMICGSVAGAIALPFGWRRVVQAQSQGQGQRQGQSQRQSQRPAGAPATGASANAGFYRFSLGQFRCVSLSDGILQPPAKLFAGNASPEQLQAALRAGFLTETLKADTNVLYVDTGKNKVLIDVGSGSLNGPGAGKLLSHMAAAGLNPKVIDTVIITHAHGDHVGGFSKLPRQVFPKARYYISSPEWRFWMAANPTLPKLLGGPELVKGMAATAKQQLEAIRPQVTQVAPEQEIVPGITSISTPGHTPGHIALRIRSGDAQMIHTADVVHIVAINLWHPDWMPVFDGDPAQAVQTRQAVLAQIARDRTLMFAYHFPFPGLGHIRPRSGGGYDWQPVQWTAEG